MTPHCVLCGRHKLHMHTVETFHMHQGFLVTFASVDLCYSRTAGSSPPRFKYSSVCRIAHKKRPAAVHRQQTVFKSDAVCAFARHVAAGSCTAAHGRIRQCRQVSLRLQTLLRLPQRHLPPTHLQPVQITLNSRNILHHSLTSGSRSPQVHSTEAAADR